MLRAAVRSQVRWSSVLRAAAAAGRDLGWWTAGGSESSDGLLSCPARRLGGLGRPATAVGLLLSASLLEHRPGGVAHCSAVARGLPIAQGQEAPAALLAQARHYFTPISVEFSEDVAGGPKVRVAACSSGGSRDSRAQRDPGAAQTGTAVADAAAAAAARLPGVASTMPTACISVAAARAHNGEVSSSFRVQPA